MIVFSTQKDVWQNPTENMLNWAKFIQATLKTQPSQLEAKKLQWHKPLLI